MRNFRNSVIRFSAFLSVLVLASGATVASASDKGSLDLFEVKSKECKSIGTGPYKGAPSFFSSAGESSCTSSCCYAQASCSGAATTSCSETGCTASCSDGSSASYTCPVS